MGKRKTTLPSSTGDGANVYPIFVDTNLDTHLALIVSDTDTVFDLKKQIKLEHPRCFPTVGNVKVNAIKVKRRGHLYHLSDSMLVKSAFGGVNKSWFLYVDASSSEKQTLKQHIGKPDSSNHLALPWVTDCPSNSRHEYRCITDNHCKNVDSDSNKRSGLEVQKDDAGSEGMVSKKRLRDMQRDSPMEGDSESGPAARKKRKTERNELSGNTFEKDKVLVYGTTDVTSKADGTNQETFRLEQEKIRNATSDGLSAGAMDDDHISTISIREKKKKDKKRKGNIISEKPLNQLYTVVPEVQEDDGNRTSKENGENFHNHSRELVQEVLEGIKAPLSTMNLPKDEDNEREAFQLHDLKKNGNHAAQDNIGFDNQLTEGDRVEKRERNKDVSLSHDPEVKLTERGERVYRGDKDASHEELLLTSKISDPKDRMECENTVVGKKKKRKTKKFSATNEDDSVLKDGNEGVNRVSVSEPNSAFDGHLIDETKKRESILSHNEGKEIAEKKAEDSEKVISNEPETDINQGNAEHLNEKSRKKMDKLGGTKRRKDGAKIGAARNEKESVVKHDSDNPCATVREDKNLSHTNCEGISEKKSIESHITAGGGTNLLDSGAEILLPTETNGGKLDEDVIVASNEGENASGTNRKKKKKVKKSNAKDENASVMKLDTDAVIISTPAVVNPASDGHLTEKLQKDECVSVMERAGPPEERAADAPHRVPDGGSDDVIGKEAETLISSGTSMGQESVKDRIRSRKKKSQSNTATSFNGFPTQEQEGEVDNSHLNQADKNQEYAPRTDKGIDRVTREVTGAAKSKIRALEQSSKLELETEKSNGIEHVSPLSQKTQMDVCLSEVPPSPVNENIVEADTDYKINVSNGGEGIDFKQYFVPGENHKGGTPTNKVKEAKKLERSMKSKKTKEKVDVPSVGSPRSHQKSLLSTNNHVDETSQIKKSTSTQSRRQLSVVENNGIVSTSKKSPEVSVGEMKAPNSRPVDQIKTPKVAGQSNVESVSMVTPSVRAAKRNNVSLVGSSSNSDSSVRSRRVVNNKRDFSLDQSDMAVGKTAAKNTGEVVNNSQRMKSLLATPGAIFGEDSSNSSADDNGAVDSDTSTRTPSDKSLSSELEGESDSSMDSGRNGSYTAKGKGRRSYLVDSQSSDMKNKSFGEILRSSSRFKKAKLTASQNQEDAENIDFVPDSQPVS